MFSQIKLASYLAVSITMTSGLLIDAELEYDRDNPQWFMCKKDRDILLQDPPLYLQNYIDHFAFKPADSQCTHHYAKYETSADKNLFSNFVYGYLIPTIERMLEMGKCEHSFSSATFDYWTCTAEW